MALEPPVDPSALRLEQARGAFIFFSYAHQDKRFRDRLENHLSNLKYRGLITTWHDREIRAGEEWMQQIDIYLNKAHVILLLISADFMASDFCYRVEMKRALERHEQRKADVIPILLRPVLFTDAPFAKLQMLPTNSKPITQWRDRDSAFVDIACGIEKVTQKYSVSQLGPDIPIPLELLPDRQPPTTVDEVPLELDIPIVLGPPPEERHPTTKDEAPLDPFIHYPPISFPSYLLTPPPPPAYPTPPPIPNAPRWRLLLFPIVIGLLIASALLQFPLDIYPFIGLLLLIAGVVTARKVIGANRARSEQRRAQEAREAARKRMYYEEAIEAYRRALSRNQRDADALRGIGNALYALGYYDQALDAFTQAIHFGLSPAAYAGLGNVCTRLKRYNEAVAAYEKAIELDPTVTLNYGDFMRSLRALGRKEEAEQVRARVKQLGYEDEE